jgi:hypothetical protein
MRSYRRLIELLVGVITQQLCQTPHHISVAVPACRLSGNRQRLPRHTAHIVEHQDDVPHSTAQHSSAMCTLVFKKPAETKKSAPFDPSVFENLSNSVKFGENRSKFI